MIVQVVRRCAQLATLFVVVALPLLSLYAHYRAARCIEDEVLMAGLRAEAACRMIHPLVDGMDEPQLFLDNNKGTLWSMRIFGADLTDPLAAVETLAASKHLHWPLFASILIPVGVTLLLGKVFCSWMCPGYLLFELAGKLRKLLALAEIPPAAVRFAHRTKYVFLLTGLIVTAVASAPLFALIYPPAVISRALHIRIYVTKAIFCWFPVYSHPHAVFRLVL